MEHGAELQHLIYIHSAFFRYHCAFHYQQPLASGLSLYFSVCAALHEIRDLFKEYSKVLIDHLCSVDIILFFLISTFIQTFDQLKAEA